MSGHASASMVLRLSSAGVLVLIVIVTEHAVRIDSGNLRKTPNTRRRNPEASACLPWSTAHVDLDGALRSRGRTRAVPAAAAGSRTMVQPGRRLGLRAR